LGHLNISPEIQHSKSDVEEEREKDTKRTGIVYDARMLAHRNIFPDLLDYEHPEDPRRISTIYEMIYKLSILKQCVRVPARLATPSELLLFHTKRHCDDMEKVSGKYPADIA
jgi:acetoin utilization deacetylase AcuC-like enzyme